MFSKFTIICSCGNTFERKFICNPKTLRTWVCPRQQAAEKVGNRIAGEPRGRRLFTVNLDSHRTRPEELVERFARLRDVAQNGWERERYAASAQLRKEGTFHVEP